jgi:hypothetical protein
MGMNSSVGPCQDYFFELFHVVHFLQTPTVFLFDELRLPPDSDSHPCATADCQTIGHNDIRDLNLIDWS